MILNFENVYKSYGERQLIEDVTFYLKPGDRMGLVAKNGTGKSTLLKLAASREEPDQGKVSYDRNVRVSFLQQELNDDPEKTVLEQVLSSQPADSREVAAYEAESMLNKLGIEDRNVKMGELSGGQRKRVALVQCLVAPADLLILDEPTNHLDFPMIQWLEKYLLSYSGALLFVTHDRYFLENVASQTAELFFGKLYISDGGYSSWLNAKAQRQEMAAASERKRQSTLRRELAWVLQGPCARGTKSRERLERYELLKAQLPPQTEGTMDEIKTVSSRLGKKTIEMKNITKSYNGKQILPEFSYNLLRDDRLGIIALNGSGKSSLLNLFAGRIQPDSGSVETGETVKIGYFMQHSDELDGEMTALDYVKEFGERIETEDGYLSAEKLMELFLFPGELQHRKICKLSGGEKRRLYLLGILASSPNVLLLDEPTNDLDIPTMQVLENYLVDFPGAIVAVSHDRYFLDRVCRHFITITPGKQMIHHNGGYTDYFELIEEEEKQRKAAAAEKPSGSPAESQRPEKQKKLKFTFKEEREFQTIDADIEKLENAIKANEAAQAENATDYVKLQELMEEQNALQAQLDEKMDRWLYLNDLAEKIKNQ